MISALLFQLLIILAVLRNPKFKIRPIYQVLQDYLQPLRKDLEGGPYVQYNITGQLNRHPRAAMRSRTSEDRDKYVDFYDQVVSDI